MMKEGKNKLNEELLVKFLMGECSEEELREVNTWLNESDDNARELFRIEDRELRRELSEAINELPDKCKMVFKLSYLHDMKNKEIAETMGISLRTVEAHMYKALKFLRKRLGYLNFMLVLFLLNKV